MLARPTYSQPQPERWPKVFSNTSLATFNLNLPGASQSPGTQFMVRTQVWYCPALSKVTLVVAFFTFSPIPWAMRYGEPICSTNCGSTTHPPGFSKLSASTKRFCELMLAMQKNKPSANNILWECVITSFFLNPMYLFLDNYRGQ